jgi:excisionase family DNA binding protein
MPDLHPMLSPKQVAELLACSRRTIDRCLTDGSIPYIKLRGLVRIPYEAIADLLRGGKVDTRRRARRAQAEMHGALAGMGAAL